MHTFSRISYAISAV